MNKLKQQISFLINDYCDNKHKYNFNLKNQTLIRPTKSVDGVIDLTNPTKELDNILTHFVVYEMMKNTKSLTDVLLLTNVVFVKALNEYRIKNAIGRNKLIFISKGGIITSTILRNFSLQLPEAVKRIYSLHYKELFSRSDLDFTISINKDLDNYEQIYKDLSELSYYLLDIIRTHIRQNIYDYFDYYKYNDEYKKYTLHNLRKGLNNSNYIKTTPDISICKLIYNKIYNEEPCAHDIIYENDTVHDRFIASDIDGAKVFYPKYLGEQNFHKIKNDNDFHISYNSSIEFSYADKFTKFNLVRIKIPFSVHTNNIKNELIENDDNKYYGELIDVSISHKSSTNYAENNDTDYYKIGDNVCTIYTISYQINELYFMLFLSSKYPWSINKYIKRLHRLFALSIVQNFNLKIHNQSYLRSLNIIINNMLKLQTNADAIVTNYYPITKLPPSNLFTLLINYINIIIDSLNSEINDKQVELEMFAEFIAIVYEQLSIYNQLINEYDSTKKSPKFVPQLTRQSSGIGGSRKIPNMIKYKPVIQIGGLYACSKHNSLYMLPQLIKNFINYSDINIYSNVSDLFIKSYKYLIDIYHTRTTIEQLFIDHNGNIIYDSKDDEYDVDMYNRKITHTNDQLNIYGMIFFSFLLEYHLLLITFSSGNDFNTESNLNNNNYKLQWLDNYTMKRIYRDNSKKDIVYLLENFCKTVNRLRLRFLIVLIYELEKSFHDIIPVDLLTNKFNMTFNDIKKIMIPIDHNKIDKYVENDEYNYIFFNWKKRLVSYIQNQYTDPTGIKNPALNIDVENKSELSNHIIGVINKSIINAVTQVTQQDDVYEEYIADPTGFFSWIHMIPRKTTNIGKKYGCCITSTYLEVYLLHQIHENPHNIKIGLQNHTTPTIPGARHPYWKYTQDELGINVSHWTSAWSYKNKKGVDTLKLFRNIDSYDNNGIYTYSRDKKKFLSSLIYPIIDNANALISQNNINGHIRPDGINEIDRIFTVIKGFIDAI